MIPAFAAAPGGTPRRWGAPRRDRLPAGVRAGAAAHARPALPGRDARDDFRAVVKHRARVERPLMSGDPLDHEARLRTEEDPHQRALRSLTAISAPASIVSTECTPASERISFARSSF